MAALELAALLTALALRVANHRRRWHQRWIEYRLGAGRLVDCSVRGNTALRTEPAETAPPRATWVSWLFNAAMWASPVPVGALSGNGFRAIRDALAGAPMTHNDTPGRRSAVTGLG
jgi:hypothetical protein